MRIRSTQEGISRGNCSLKERQPLLNLEKVGSMSTLITQSSCLLLSSLYLLFVVVVVQALSRVSLFVTPWTAACQASLSSPISQSLLRVMSTGSLMPSNHLILCHPLLFLPSILPSIRVFSNQSALLTRWPKYWSFSFSISPSNEYSGLIFFRIHWFDLPAVQGTLKSLLQPQFKSINSLVLSFLYGPTLISIHDCWKKHGFDCMDLCWQGDVSAF